MTADVLMEQQRPLRIKEGPFVSVSSGFPAWHVLFELSA